MNWSVLLNSGNAGYGRRPGSSRAEGSGGAGGGQYVEAVAAIVTRGPI